MIAFVRRQPLAVALAGIALLLLVAIAFEAQIGARLHAAAMPAARKADAAEAKLLPPVAVVSAEQAYQQTAVRPLFTPTRRPAPSVEVAPQPAFVKGQYVLQGVTIAGDTRIALLREKTSGRIHRVEKGREVNGIKVAEVQPDSVTMTVGSDSEVVPLTVQKAVPGASAALLGPFAGGAPQPGFPTPPPPPQPATGPQNVTSMPPGTATPAAPARNPADYFGPRAPGLPGSPLGPQQQQPTATAVPLTPEELLARRRARRSEQSQ